MAKSSSRKASNGIVQYDLFRALPVVVSPLAQPPKPAIVGDPKPYLVQGDPVEVAPASGGYSYQRDRRNGQDSAKYKLGDVVYAPYLDSLNAPQREAVEYGQGPLLVIAGAGSGKTRVLTYRIAQLIARGVPPHRILALTFTNKAASEMRVRIEEAVGKDLAKTIWMGTFHSVFSRCLRKNAGVLGFSKSFTIYDPDNCKKLVRDILKGMNFSYEEKDVLRRISYLKNECISSDEYQKKAESHVHDERLLMPFFNRVYSAYTNQLKSSQAMDFDDLLFLMYKLMDEPEYRTERDEFEGYWDYILVDEFQDTNTLQLAVLHKLADRTTNLTVVGDDAQSIYAFRGAKIQNILQYDRSFPETEVKVIKLEQNYRSTPAIIRASNQLIAHNTKQMPKRVFTSLLEDRPIDYVNCDTVEDEGTFAVSQILQQKEIHGWDWREFAILYRTKVQAIPLEYKLRKNNIPYRIVGGTSFFARQEIRDVLGYLRLVVNLEDREALKRCLTRPKRNVGDSGLGKILQAAKASSIRDVLLYPQHYLTGFKQAAMDGVVGFSALIDKFLGYSQTLNAHDCIARIVDESGLKALYEAEDAKRKEDKKGGSLIRMNNINELLAGAQSFVGKPSSTDDPDAPRAVLPGTYLMDYLEYISLLVNPDDEAPDANTVTLMTIHASKGLEFNHVHVVGLEEGLFPSSGFGSGDEDDEEASADSKAEAGTVLIDNFQVEEERRLCYVAVTRARRKLVLTSCAFRELRGKEQSMEPSRFLDELGVTEDYLAEQYEP